MSKAKLQGKLGTIAEDIDEMRPMDEKSETAERKEYLEATMTGMPAKAKLGDTVDFTITVINSGDFSLSNVRVKNDLPKDVILITDPQIQTDKGADVWLNLAIDSGGQMDLGSINPSSRKILRLKARINSKNGPWTNKAEVFGVSPRGKTVSANCYFMIVDSKKKDQLYRLDKLISGNETVASSGSVSGFITLGEDE